MADRDCVDGEACTHADGRHVCVSTRCAVGRPFLVRGHERVAARARSYDWIARGLTPDVRALPPSTRACLADHWTRIGLMEHASVAAFARFTLQLLAFGAPPDLVRQAQRAMGDETEHAQIAFRLASAYAGRVVGPSDLDVSGALDDFCVEQALATLLREGCIGETVAAIEAREALERAIDPAVREALAIIARDELRHAQLAWRTVSWLVASGRIRAQAVLEEAERAAAQAVFAPHTTELDPEVAAHGVVDAATRDELRRQALGVVATCLRRVLDAKARSSPGADCHAERRWRRCRAASA
jgi:hypothetical protein